MFFENAGAIDVLSIDTEGNDMRVLLGAARLLGAEMVRFLEFEYHNIGHWATADLSGNYSVYARQS